MALVLVPQSLAYAQLAGMPAVTGLYAAAIPPLVAACWASSRYLQTGPTALTALLTLSALSGVAAPASTNWVTNAASLAIVVGVTRVVIGIVRAGALTYLLSEPMLAGFTRGAAVIIVATQVPALLGVPADPSGMLTDGWGALSHPETWSSGAVATAAGCVLIILLLRHVHALIPGILISAVVALVAVRLGVDAGPVVGDIPVGVPALSLPGGGYEQVLLPGVVIALIGFSESAAIARTYALLDRTKWDPNRDFIGQGLGNVASGLVGAFPVGGSFTRSALNRMAGATSSRSGAIAALAVLAFLPFSDVLATLPRAALAAFVVLAAMTLFRPPDILRLWRLSRVQFGVAAATFVATLALAPHVERAVVLGVVVAIAVHLWRETTVATEISADGKLLEICPSGVVWFANAQAVADVVVCAVGAHPDVRVVRLRLEGFGRVDLTAALAIARVIDDLRATGIEVKVTGLPPVARPVLERVLGAVPAGEALRPHHEPPGRTPARPA